MLLFDLENVITKLNEKTGYANQKLIIVMEAGTATGANIQYLKDEKYDCQSAERKGRNNTDQAMQ